ncbi:MAG: hypothetical protein RSB71_01940 [Bacilli bacterium]
MKNKKIIKVLNKIEPTTFQKEKILENIKIKKTLNLFKYLLPLVTCLFLFIIGSGTSKEIKPVNFRMQHNINYNNTCYTKDKLVTKKSLGTYLDVVGENNIDLQGYKIYKYKKTSSLVITNDEEYILYVKCN